MSNVKVCDICGRKIPHRIASFQTRYYLLRTPKLFSVSEGYDGGVIINNELDICPECMEKIIDEVKEAKNE